MNTIPVIGAIVGCGFLINYSLDTLSSTILGAMMAIVLLFLLAITPFAIMEDASQIANFWRTRKQQLAWRRGEDIEDDY